MSTKQQVISKTATKTEINTEQSQRLIQTMLTMSFGCLAFLRGLFPDDNFVDQRFVPEKIDKNYNKNNTSQTNSIKIKTLVRGKSTEVDLFLDWLEKGVFQSVRFKFLKALSLGIFTDEQNPTNLLENYIFTFDYSSDNRIGIKIDTEKSGTVTSSLLDSRKMVQQLMRRFIIITQSLEPLPQKKYLTMRLMFNENTPQDFQPNLFKDATFEKRPTLNIPINTDLESSSVGTLDTKHHQMSIRVLSVNDIEENEDQEKKIIEYRKIDPFEIFDQDQASYTLTQLQHSYATSQTTNILGDILKSSQSSIQPTQAVVLNNIPNVECECALRCPQNSTKIKQCKNCRKYVHGICYGNQGYPKIDKCLSCVYGPMFDPNSSSSKDLMLLRKCYRFLSRNRIFSPSINEFRNSIIESAQIDENIIERVNFAISTFFRDGILSLSQESKTSTSKTNNKNKALGTKVLVDAPGIYVPGVGELDYGKEYTWYFKYQSPDAHSCYIDVLADTKKEVENWLEEVKILREQMVISPTSTVDLRSLVINDTNTQDSFQIGQKRKKIYLESSQFEIDGNLVTSDTVNAMTPNVSREEVLETPKKIRKISVSKKTLRSVW